MSYEENESNDTKTATLAIGQRAESESVDPHARIWLRITHEENGWAHGYFCNKPQDDGFYSFVPATPSPSSSQAAEEIAKYIDDEIGHALSPGMRFAVDRSATSDIEAIILKHLICYPATQPPASASAPTGDFGSADPWPPNRVWLPDGVVMLAAVSPELENVDGAFWVRETQATKSSEASHTPTVPDKRTCPPSPDDGWVTFGRIKVDVENETETFERIPLPDSGSEPTIPLPLQFICIDPKGAIARAHLALCYRCQEAAALWKAEFGSEPAVVATAECPKCGSETGNKLTTLLISQEKAAWMKSLESLNRRFTKRDLAGWWCQLNARKWPNDCPVNQLIEESEEWNQSLMLQAVEKAINDKKYLTLRWQADWGTGKVQRIAISELALIDGAR